MVQTTEGKTKQESKVGMIISALILLASMALFIIDPFVLKTLYRALILLAGVVIAGFVFFKSPQGVRFYAFAQETKIELKKVVWPTKDETLKTTGMILVAVIVVSIFLWMVDAFFTWAVKLLTS